MDEKIAVFDTASDQPAEIDFEPQNPRGVSAVSTPTETPRDNPSPELPTSQNTVVDTAKEPQMGDTRTVDGQKHVYFLGFGWIEDNDTPNECVYVEDMYENGNKVGRSCGDINNQVGAMD